MKKFFSYYFIAQNFKNSSARKDFREKTKKMEDVFYIRYNHAQKYNFLFFSASGKI
jgi:hypothetical protein